jgi:purine-cytosine permease-like protein
LPFLDPDLNSLLISIVTAIIIYEYHIIRRYEEKLNKLEESLRWMEYAIKEKESKKQ